MNKLTDAAGGGGWLEKDTELLLNHQYRPSLDVEVANHTILKTVQRFDVMLFRIPHGWLTLDEITQETLVETIEMAHKVFGVRTIIVMTLYLNNNVKTMEDLNQMHRVNDMIRNVIGNWQDYIEPNTIEHALLLEFGRWTDQLTELNAKLAGGLDLSMANYTLERWSCSRYPPSIAMICTNPVQPGQCHCMYVHKL